MDVEEARELQRKYVEATPTQKGAFRVEGVTLVVCEVQGYPEMDKVAIGDWNDIKEYEDHSFDTLDDSPSAFGEELSNNGWELLWCDEWGFCESCRNLIRTSPTSYSWKPQYYTFIDGIVCRDCILSEEDIFNDYIEDIKCSFRKAMTFGQSKLEDRGWTCSSEFVNGLREHQDDSPEAISEFLDEVGVPYIFSIDSTGQFDTNFSVYVPSGYDILSSEEWDRLDKKCSISPAAACKKALSSGDVKSTDDDNVVVNTINSDGTVDSKEVTPEEFVEGSI